MAESVYDKLASLIGPLGPLVDDAELTARKRDLIRGDPVVATEALLEALRRPSFPPWVSPRDAADAVVEVLEQLASHRDVTTMLLDAVESPTTRYATLGALGNVRQEWAAHELATRIERGDLTDWTEDDLLYLVSAFGEMPGPGARRGLDIVAQRAPMTPELARELDIAWQSPLHKHGR